METRREYGKRAQRNYVLKAKDGTKMLYGMDTGLYEEETLDFMKNQNLDIWSQNVHSEI